jgi:ACS family glucarate transporter-like MFS transporter
MNIAKAMIQESTMSTISTASSAIKRTNKRYWIVVMLFIVTSFNYGDRATLSIAGTSMAEDIGLDPVGMGYIFSAFSWAYVIGQIPGGWLLDRFGSKRVYFWSIFIWSLFTLLQGFVDLFSGFGIVMALFALRFLVGLAEAPSFPGNSRIVAAWFPAHERGTAVAIFNSAQYFATVIFAPIMGWLTHAVGWSHVFFFMGGLGIILSFIWLKVLHDPKDHPSINQAELDYIEAGGALINMDQKQEKQTKVKGEKWFQIKQLLRSRMMVGVYIGQYCINGLTYFFITWFPVYLVQARGMSILKAGFVASVPAICGFIGGVLGGVISDYLMRRTQSLTFARKTPIVLGMLLSMSMIFCNYVETEWMVVGIMAAAFFGKGLGALGWAVMADTAPKEISGLSGGLFNMFGNISGIVTPIAIGYIIGTTGSFNGALVYVGIHALLAVASYLFIVGDIKRIELKPMAKASRQ